MDRNALHQRFADRFVSEPQKAALAENALVAILAGIDELAKLGYTYELVEIAAGPVNASNEYPKMLYHDSLGTRTVNSKDEEAKAGAGWRDSPTAQQPPPVPETRTVLAPGPGPGPDKITGLDNGLNESDKRFDGDPTPGAPTNPAPVNSGLGVSAPVNLPDRPGYIAPAAEPAAFVPENETEKE